MVARLKSIINSFKNSCLLQGIFVLGISGVLCKLIGAFYRIPLTNILGSEGMGVYGLVYPIYSLLLVISSSALPLGLSKIVAERVALGDTNYVKRLKKVALNFMLFIGGILTLLLILLSDAIVSLQGVQDAKLGFVFIAPAVLLVCLLCVYRGVFQGYCNMRPTAISQLIEQAVKLVLGLGFSILLLPFGVAYAVGGAMLAITISEALALLYLMIIFNASQNCGKGIKDESNLPNNIGPVESNNGQQEQDVSALKVPQNGSATGKVLGKGAKRGESGLTILANLLKVTIPVTFGGLVIPICLVVDSFLIVNLLSHYFGSAVTPIADYGLYSNVVNTLINLPIVIVGSLGSVAVPLIAKLIQAKQPLKMREIVTKCINFTAFICVPCVLVFAFFPNAILGVLYPALPANEIETASRLLVISSSTVIALGMFYVSTSILQGTGKNAFSIVNCCVCSVLRIVIYIFLMKIYGIYAVAMASALMYLIMAVVNVVYMIARLGAMRPTLIRVFVTALIFAFLTLLVYLLLYGFMHSFAILPALVVGGIVYLVLNLKIIV